MYLINKIVDWYFTKNALPYWCMLLLDCFICYLSGIFVFWLFYHGALTFENLGILSKTIIVYMCFNLIGFKVFHTYSNIIRYSSFVDLQRIGYAMALSCLIAEIAHYIIYWSNFDFIRLQGRQILLMYIVATILMWGVRVLVKTLYDVTFSSEKGRRAMIYGIREGGVAIAKSIRNTKPTQFQLKGFITHEHSFSGRVMMGVKIYEANKELIQQLKAMNIQSVLISPMQVENFRNDQELQDELLNAGIHIYMMPPTHEWKAGEPINPQQLKEINIEDLLPRDQIEVDMEGIGKMLTGKRVMITGSAGSIGSEMVRQVALFKPSELILIDQAETPQHDIRLMMNFSCPSINAETIVASICNKQRMDNIFQQYKPEYVFHAAAYKHVPMMENNPSESIQNNVWGTKVIADLSVRYGVKKFVMVSTDKAVNPTNVMGCSKRICEIYCQSLNRAIESGELMTADGTKAVTQFVTTRFGNVLGSNGSVIPLFRKQIRKGGPVTVTDPNVVRYFMLIPEACKLVLEAGTQGKGGQILVFDMGKPVNIASLAKRMIKLSGAEGVEIKYTGLRDGEKLYEEVLSSTENTLPSFHKKIRIAQVREYDYNEVEKDMEDLMAIAQTYDDMAIVRKMKDIVPEFVSNNSIYESLDKKS
jgi:FlaA1/EpsC-like NDP-sugar epimerase